MLSEPSMMHRRGPPCPQPGSEFKIRSGRPAGGEGMTSPTTGAPRPGVTVGSTSEFSLFFRVKPGHGEALREAVGALTSAPGYRSGDYDLPIASIHEARFVLFDGDSRLLFATSFDGPWDAYMEDFAAKPLHLFDAIFQHVEGYEGLPDLGAVKEF